MTDRGSKTLRTALTVALILAICPSCTDNEWPKSACMEPDTQGLSVQFRRDYQYARYCFFDVGRVGDEWLFQVDDFVVQFELYELISSPDVTRGTGGVAFEDVRTPESFDYVAPIRGRFEQLGSIGSEWVLITDDPSREFPYLKFIDPVPRIETKTLAYRMDVNRNGSIVSFGGDDGDSLQLQLLKLSNPAPDDPFWDAEWKNVYDLGVRYIDYNEFQLDIYKGQPGDEQSPFNQNHQDGVPYLQILGLDRTIQTGAHGADGRIDNNPAILDLESGLVIFPDRRPFDTDVGYSPTPEFRDSTLNERVPAIYETDNYTELQKRTTYYFRMAFSQRPAEIYVGHPYLVPDSEIITYNGRRLIKNTDYVIDYEFGNVTLINEALFDPSGDLLICYAYCGSKL